MTYYVRQDGSGTECSASGPCAPGTGVIKLRPGDTLTIQGTLTIALELTKSGTAESWITITGGKIEAPQTEHDALLVEGSFLEIRDLEVTGGEEFGVRVKGHDVKLVNVSVHDTVWENRSGDACTDGRDGGWGRALTFAPEAHDVEVSGGAVFNNCGEGVGFTMNQNSYLHDTKVYDNYSRNVYIANASGVRVENITSYYSDPGFYRGGQPGRCIGLAIESGDFPTYGNMMRDTVIRGNQLSDCQGINFYQEVDGQLPSNVLVEGNTFTRVPAPQVDIPGTEIVQQDNVVE
jgi:hypothetical protein